MSHYYTPVKRLTALRLRLSQLEGKLKFAIRRGIRKLILSALFAIAKVEDRLEDLSYRVQLQDRSVPITQRKPATPTPATNNANIRYVDREIAVWEEAMQGLLPQWFVHNTNKTIADILLNKDTSFSTYQYKHYVDTGKCAGLLETVQTDSGPVTNKDANAGNLKPGVKIPTTVGFSHSTVKPRSEFVENCEKQIKVTLTEDEKFSAYYDSLQLAPLQGAQSSEQLALAQYFRTLFVRNSLYRLLAYDSRNPLLVFAPVILKLRKYTQAYLWINSEDYQVRSDITWQATNKYYAAYPEKKHHLARCAKGRGSKSDRFFFTRKSSVDQWEVWHYVE